MALIGTNIGKFDRKITLRFPVVVRNAIGEQVEGFANGQEPFAQWTPITGREFFAADSKQTDMVGTFRIRYRAGIGADWRVFWAGKIYELVSVPVEVGRKSYLDLMVKLLADQNAGTLYPTAQTFMVDLDEGDNTKDIDFPAAFASVPRGIYVQLIIPDGGYEFGTAVVSESITDAGFTVNLGADVPGTGYKLSIQSVL